MKSKLSRDQMNNQSEKKVLFNRIEDRYLILRNGFLKFFEILNIIAEDPYSLHEDYTAKINYLPIHWSTEQIYLAFEYLFQKKYLQNLCFIITNEKGKICDFFLMNVEEKTPLKQKSVSFLSFSPLFLEDNQNNRQFITDLDELFLKNAPVHQIINTYLETVFSIKDFAIIVLPYNLRNHLEILELPVLNQNALDFYNFLIDSYNLSKSVPKFSKFNYILQNFVSSNILFKSIKASISEWNSVDLDKWAKVWVSILDGLSMNIVMILNDKPVVCFKMIVENEKLTINPLSMHFFKNLVGLGKNPQKLAEECYRKTGTRTIVILEKDFLDFVEFNAQDNRDYFNYLAHVISLIYSSKWYPDSLMNSFLGLFGLEIGSGIPKFPLAIRDTLAYFESVLLLMFNKESGDNISLGTIVQLTFEKDLPKLKMIESEKYSQQYLSYQGEAFEKFSKIVKYIEEDQKIHYNMSLGFDISVISDSISARNINSLLGLSSITGNLPLVASLGALFAGMKALGGNDENREHFESIINLKEPEPLSPILSNEKMHFLTFYEEFLRKGILCIVDENKKAIKKIRSPIYSAQGFLGLDMETLRDLILFRLKEEK